ncbi:alpha/beta hydrolase [Planococcus sp. N028]|uniref:Alpha/beta hydrolase n=1 Tax=Planococcus shixiaomingii TaxID=3058393 RepID=A0ABT8N3I9_9BACL|nr:alpha/beta hydrolase [Planococcus sp. N028]MDN7242457.1 alpha/beta hydrolase [Planococcus sp. N028]
MLKIEQRSIQGYKGMEVPFQYIKNESESKSLAIMLPGAGYTTDSPLFHYSTELFRNRSVDVLEVNYQYKNKEYDDFTMEELSEAIKYDVKKIFDQELSNTPYENFYIIGKSLGTIAMSSELQRPLFKNAKVVWLTPLFQQDDVFQAMLASTHKALCFIGDADRWYIKERYDQVMNKPTMTSKLFSAVDHSMDCHNDVSGSIDVLKSVISDIQNF